MGGFSIPEFYLKRTFFPGLKLVSDCNKLKGNAIETHMGSVVCSQGIDSPYVTNFLDLAC
jgi:hypothetical protein